jgi:hypothetical protein
VTGSTTAVAWLSVSFSPTQGEGGSVQCGEREKKAGALLTSSGGRQLCSKAATTSNGRGHDGVAPRQQRWATRAAGDDKAQGGGRSKSWGTALSA